MSFQSLCTSDPSSALSLLLEQLFIPDTDFLSNFTDGIKPENRKFIYRVIQISCSVCVKVLCSFNSAAEKMNSIKIKLWNNEALGKSHSLS